MPKHNQGVPVTIFESYPAANNSQTTRGFGSSKGIKPSSIARVGGSDVRYLNIFFVLAICIPSALAQTASPKKLTIEKIFAEGGVTGRAPEAIKWSPDGTKVSFVQRDDEGEHGELWYVDAATGERKVLVSAAKLASLAPDTNKVKDEREKERLTRYHVAAYLWAPDSKHLIFDSQGQLWVFDLASNT